MIVDERRRTVQAAYDELGPRFGEWGGEIEGDPWERFLDELTARLTAASDDLDALLIAFRRFGHDRPEAFRLLFTTVVDADRLAATSAPVLRATTSAVGETHALDAARLLTAWATGFVTMELGGAFRLGGDLDQAYDYGRAHLVASLSNAHDGDRPAQGS